MDVRTLREWLSVMPNGVQVIDPDGFNRRDPLMLDRMYSREEYDFRENLCTIITHPIGDIPHNSWSGKPCPIRH